MIMILIIVINKMIKKNAFLNEIFALRSEKWAIAAGRRGKFRVFSLRFSGLRKTWLRYIFQKILFHK
jgi:hypothetical protein